MQTCLNFVSKFDKDGSFWKLQHLSSTLSLEFHTQTTSKAKTNGTNLYGKHCDKINDENKRISYYCIYHLSFFSFSYFLFLNMSFGAGRTPSSFWAQKFSKKQNGCHEEKEKASRGKWFFWTQSPSHVVNPHKDKPLIVLPLTSALSFNLQSFSLHPSTTSSSSLHLYLPLSSFFSCSNTNCSCERFRQGLKHVSGCYATQSLATSCKLSN